MIVVDFESDFLMVSQPEHAHLAAELIRYWQRPALRESERFAELLFATREHDNGWQELDSAPMWNGERNRPHDFLTLPERERFDLWRRGTARFRNERPYVAALIAQHAYHLLSNGDSDPSAELEELLEELVEARDSILESLGLELEDLLVDYDYLELADLISLAACSQWNREFRLHGYRFALLQAPSKEVPGRLEIEPFPFAGVTTFPFRARTVERVSYRGDADLASAAIRSPLAELSLKIVPSERDSARSKAQ